MRSAAKLCKVAIVCKASCKGLQIRKFAKRRKTCKFAIVAKRRRSANIELLQSAATLANLKLLQSATQLCKKLQFIAAKRRKT
jgi:hypothetical protein